jgi:hypothetical protein
VKQICITILFFSSLLLLQGARPVPFTGKVAIDGINYHGQAMFSFLIISGNGNVLWKHNENASQNPISVNVQNGRYSVLLGGQGMTPLPSLLFLNNEDLRIKVHFDNGDGKGMRHLTPDIAISSQPHALAAEWAKFAQIANGVTPNSITLNMLAPEVRATLTNQHVTDGLVGWWPFDGNASDMSGNGNHGTVSGATLAPDKEGNQNSAFYFDGVNDYIDLGKLGDFSSKVGTSTISFWIKANNQFDNKIKSVMGLVDSVGGHYPVLKVELHRKMPFIGLNASQGNTLFYIRDKGNKVYGAYTDEIIYNDSWYNVTWVIQDISKSQSSLYINGKLISWKHASSGGALPNPNDFSQSWSQNFILGASNYKGSIEDFSNVYLDDVRIYDRPLSHDEVLHVMHSNSCGDLDCQCHLKISDRTLDGSKLKEKSITKVELSDTIKDYLKPKITSQPQNLNALQGTSASLWITAEGRFLLHQWYHNGIELGGETNSTLILNNLSDSAEGNYTVKISNDFGQVLSNPIVVDVNNSWISNGLVAWWPFDGNASDMSGNGNHGTVTGATLVPDRNGNAQKAFFFDGNDDFINVGTLGNFSSKINSSTISFWIRTVNSGSQFKSLMGLVDDVGVSYPVFKIELNRKANPTLAASSGDTLFFIRDKVGKVYAAYTNENIYNDSWHHLTWVINDISQSQSSLYIDGEIIDWTAAHSGGVSPNPDDFSQSWNQPFVMGASNYKGSIEDFSNIYLDDIRIYERALSNTEVKALKDFNN